MRYLLPLLCIPLASCDHTPANNASSADSRTVLTTFYPTTYFATRITSGKLDVACPCPADADPIFWKPSRETLERYQAAALIITNGADFEKWIDSASLPSTRIVDTARGFRESFITFKTMTHSHGPSGSHSHTGTDGHTWVDPVNAKAQASAIRDAFAAKWPAEAAAFTSSYDALAKDLDALDARFRELSPLAKDVVILTSHPAYSYPAKRYGWTLVNLDIPPDEAPSADQWKSIENAFANAGDRKRIILFEADPLPATATRIRTEFKAIPVTFSPCESAEPGADYLGRMNANLDRLHAALQGH